MEQTKTTTRLCEEDRLNKLLAEKEALLAQYQGTDKVISFPEMQEFFSRQKQKVNNFSPGSGFVKLNELIGGFEGGEVVVVSGPTKQGKTLLCQSLTVAFEREGIKSVWFNYELMPKQFLSRFSDVPLPGAYMPMRMKANTLSWIEDRIHEGKIKYETKVVFIDHLHFIVDFERMRNPSIEIGAIMRGLKNIAKKHNVCIFLVAHIGKVERGKEKRLPTYHDARDSSFIAQECDTFLMVGRVPDKAKDGIIDQAKVSVEVSRKTSAMRKIVKMVKAGGLLRELTQVEPRGETEDDEEE